MTLDEALTQVAAEQYADDLRGWHAYTQGVDAGVAQAANRLLELACELPPGPEQDTLMGAVAALRQAR